MVLHIVLVVAEIIMDEILDRCLLKNAIAVGDQDIGQGIALNLMEETVMVITINSATGNVPGLDQGLAGTGEVLLEAVLEVEKGKGVEEVHLTIAKRAKA